jgi:hypothetical protein
MSEIVLFVRVFFRHWAGYVTGSVIIGALSVAERAGRLAVPGWIYGLIACAGVGISAFRTWRDERIRGKALEKNLAEYRATLDDVVIPDLSNDTYWLLAIAQRYRLRREVLRDVGGADTFSIWIGDTPIYFQSSRWLYFLVTYAERQGFIKPEVVPGGPTIYRLPYDTEKILEIERRRRRQLSKPSQHLYDTRTVQPVDLALPF